MATSKININHMKMTLLASGGTSTTETQVTLQDDATKYTMIAIFIKTPSSYVRGSILLPNYQDCIVPYWYNGAFNYVLVKVVDNTHVTIEDSISSGQSFYIYGVE